MTKLEMTKLRFLSAIRYDAWFTVWIPNVDLLLAHDSCPLLGSQAALLIIRCPDWLQYPTIRVPLSADPILVENRFHFIHGFHSLLQKVS